MRDKQKRNAFKTTQKGEMEGCEKDIDVYTCEQKMMPKMLQGEWIYADNKIEYCCKAGHS